MKAIVLCAGKGKRLRPITYFMPKCMVKIGKKMVLEHIIDYLHRFGIYQIIINLNYMPTKIMKYFGTKVLYSYEPELLGEEGTIQSLQNWISDDYCVVINGDTLTNLNLATMFSMCNGKSIRFMDRKIYAGVRIIEPKYISNETKSVDYQDPEAWWCDIGSFKELRRARKEYEKIGYMSDLRN